jgi:hypothetical protein
MTAAAVETLKVGFDSGIGSGGDPVTIALKGLGAPAGPPAPGGTTAPAPGRQGTRESKLETLDRELATLKTQRAQLGPQDDDKKRAFDQRIADNRNRHDAEIVLKNARPPRPEVPSPRPVQPAPPAGPVAKAVETVTSVVTEAANEVTVNLGFRPRGGTSQ